MKIQATTIANEIKAQIQVLEANDQAYYTPNLVHDYFQELSEGHAPELRLYEEVLNILID